MRCCIITILSVLGYVRFGCFQRPSARKQYDVWAARDYQPKIENLLLCNDSLCAVRLYGYTFAIVNCHFVLARNR